MNKGSELYSAPKKQLMQLRERMEAQTHSEKASNENYEEFYSVLDSINKPLNDYIRHLFCEYRMGNKDAFKDADYSKFEIDEEIKACIIDINEMFKSSFV